MKMLTISKDVPVEELVESYTCVVRFLTDEGLPCVVCGEPFWGSLGDLARQKGWKETDVDRLVERLRIRIGKSR